MEIEPDDIGETLAANAIPQGDAVGRHLRIGPINGPLYTVVGVVGDVKQTSLMSDESEAVYTTETQWRCGRDC
jgi:hypothetical protein